MSDSTSTSSSTSMVPLVRQYYKTLRSWGPARSKSKSTTGKSSTFQDKRRESLSKAFEVGRWLQNDVLLPQYILQFIKHGYDDMATIVKAINEKELEKIGVKPLGHRKKIMLHIYGLMKQKHAFKQRIYREKIQFASSMSN